ncbi:alpha/beta fold hydrolase [Rugamonas sp. FT82W]|uniref:Alpha/beta fold hydrolase n=1 Tax=Duganella vulcania TaxID=2692166 RepID=A0A845GD00_9BURK|nr:alpha/beta fold hydrolase [Duganella vulcania]MYM90808.1 alpha/beta fold hydrolase [Duganella vulcania]
MIKLMEAPMLALQVRRAAEDLGDVVYVHGSTFGAGLSVFFAFDGRSWADELNAAGFNVWGFDFAGYGASERYARHDSVPAGGLDDVQAQLRRVVCAVRERNGGRPVMLLGHSWGGSVAARYAGEHPQEVCALALFAPVVKRDTASGAHAQAAAMASHYPLTAWAQYRRFVEDVPRGHPQLLDEAHFQQWSAAFLATDAEAATRTPPAVLTPAGPQADVRALWSGQALYDPARIRMPTLLVRGKWDSVCSEADAVNLLAALGSGIKRCETLPRATHLMHLESSRGLLYNAVNDFLLGSAA